ncbi:hypothetical protein ADIARSV_1766 [Arcticibacter svalbardensis MN12-7]|uniref:Uncharacterized protein n=1 Tax=Arcticibacter svalbardensis MN12-7 TaxID=1150600 RepID=R9GTM7_9SPHI|nr:hypothetical protein ADIARSV_1766 [Arcticibacter svalbardensis MN12-7]
MFIFSLPGSSAANALIDTNNNTAAVRDFRVFITLFLGSFCFFFCLLIQK